MLGEKGSWGRGTDSLALDSGQLDLGRPPIELHARRDVALREVPELLSPRDVPTRVRNDDTLESLPDSTVALLELGDEPARASLERGSEEREDLCVVPSRLLSLLLERG